MLYLHALDYSTFTRGGGKVVARLVGDGEGCKRFQPIEGCHHASLSTGVAANIGGCDRSVGEHR